LDQSQLTVAALARPKYEDVIQDPRYREAMLAELKNLFAIGAVELCELPPGRKTIKCVWAHKEKLGADGEFIKVRSRLCPQGFRQVPGVDYDPDKVSSPTLHLESTLLLLSLTVHRDMHSCLADAPSAFSGSPNHAETYIELPQGLIPTAPNQVLRCVNSINGLKQGGYDFYVRADAALIAIGFKASVIDPCLYYRWHGERLSLIGVYVDDFRIACDSPDDLEEIKDHLRTTFNVTTAPGSWWLGMKIVHDPRHFSRGANSCYSPRVRIQRNQACFHTSHSSLKAGQDGYHRPLRRGIPL